MRLGGQTPEELTDRELLTNYLEVKETPPERAKLLLEHAESIFHLEKET